MYQLHLGSSQEHARKGFDVCVVCCHVQVLGLIFVLVSAMFFALSTVRLGRYSSRFDPLQLSTTSTTTLGLLSLTWVLISVLGEDRSAIAFRDSCSWQARDPTEAHRLPPTGSNAANQNPQSAWGGQARV